MYHCALARVDEPWCNNHLHIFLFNASCCLFFIVLACWFCCCCAILADISSLRSQWHFILYVSLYIYINIYTCTHICVCVCRSHVQFCFCQALTTTTKSSLVGAQLWLVWLLPSFAPPPAGIYICMYKHDIHTYTYTMYVHTTYTDIYHIHNTYAHLHVSII